MSMRAHRDELIQKGILLPDLASATSPTNGSSQLPAIAGKSCPFPSSSRSVLQIDKTWKPVDEGKPHSSPKSTDSRRRRGDWMEVVWYTRP